MTKLLLAATSQNSFDRTIRISELGEKIVLTSNAIPSNTLLFKTRNFEFTLIEQEFANELLDLAVSEGGSERLLFLVNRTCGAF